MTAGLRSKTGEDEAQALLSLQHRAEANAEFWRRRALEVMDEFVEDLDHVARNHGDDLTAYWLEQYHEAAEALSRLHTTQGEQDSFDLTTRQPELFGSRLTTRVSAAVEAVDTTVLRERATSQVAAAVASLADTGAASLHELEEAVSLIHEEIIREALSQAASHVRRQMVSDIVRYLIPRLRESKGTR